MRRAGLLFTRVTCPWSVRSRVRLQPRSSDLVEGAKVEEVLREVEPGQAMHKHWQLLRRDHSVLEGQDGWGAGCSATAGIWDVTT